MNKVQKINSSDKGSLHQWSKGVFFALYAFNTGPVDGTNISKSVVAIFRELTFPIDISLVSPREGNP